MRVCFCSCRSHGILNSIVLYVGSYLHGRCSEIFKKLAKFFANSLSQELLVQITGDFLCGHLLDCPGDEKVSVVFQ